MKNLVSILSSIVFSFILIWSVLLLISTPEVQGYSSCSEYGPFSYEDYSGYCKCSSGYVFQDNIFGEPYCVSGNTACWDKYGYNSRYDYLSDSCKCSYGYVFGKDSIGQTQCISQDSMCRDQLGYGASYNSLSNKCECGYGDVIDGGRCTDGDLVCHADHGYNSGYNDLNNKCECDSGYTFNDDYQCVKKQNNVYFTLLELDESENLAIIRSNHDWTYYLVEYGYGCYDFSMRRYLNSNIVVNLGTDFNLDLWDKIVLQDDSETCDIMDVDWVDSNFTLVEEEEVDYGNYYIPIDTKPTPPKVTPTTTKTIEPAQVNNLVNESINNDELDQGNISETSSTEFSVDDVVASSSPVEIGRESWFSRLWKFLFKRN